MQHPLFSGVKNQQILFSTLDIIQNAITSWKNSFWDGRSEVVGVTVKNMDDIRHLHERLANWHIAFGSCDSRIIEQTLALSNNYYFDHNGHRVIGKAEYIALHKTTNQEITPYMHTVLLPLEGDGTQIFPLFVKHDRVCIGKDPVGSGLILKFDPRDESFLTTSPVDNFHLIKKLKG